MGARCPIDVIPAAFPSMSIRRSLALAAALAAIPSLLAAQASAACAQELDWVAGFAAVNYAGYADKVTAQTRPAYDSLLGHLRDEAARATPGAACDSVLGRWVAFFQDRHLTLVRQPVGAGTPGGPSFPRPSTAAAAPPDDSVRARFATWARVPLDEAAARERLTALGAERAAIEGIWESADRRYRTAVLRDPRDAGRFVMTILRADSVWWMPGQVKATFTTDTGGAYATEFFMRDHSTQRWRARVARNVLVLPSVGAWVRRWPATPDDVSPALERTLVNARLAAYDVAPGVVLVQVPTFNDPRGIDSLFAAEGARIRGAERLIIDVRGNGGGSDYNYRELTPLLATGRVTTIGTMALATDANIAANDAMAHDTTYPEAQRRGLAWLTDQMRKHRGGWAVLGDDEHDDRVRTRPSAVAVLVDRGCASSCEQFLLAARQSRKVTLYGDRSAGVLDYGNVRSTPVPGSTLVLNRPITRTKRLPNDPVDNVGIAPQVRVPADEVLPVAWVLQHMAGTGRFD